LFASNGILFNHESPLRPHHFVTKKIIEGAFQIKTGQRQKLHLGKLDIHRDWGWAPEYVEAMWRMLQLPKADDFVIATGITYSLESFVDTAFREVGLHWTDHVEIDDSLNRPSDILISRGDVTKARAKLGWKPSATMPQVVQLMMAAEREVLK
jgi:GDPmannose 4,6-dehydratase